MNTFESTLTGALLRTRSDLTTLVDRVAVDEDGQTTAEYVAVIVMIAGIIALLFANDSIADTIRGVIQSAFGNVQETVEG